MDNLAAEVLMLFFKGILWCFVVLSSLFLTTSYFYTKSPNAFHPNTSIIKTTSEPKKTWKLKVNGQKVDTVWVYTFGK